MENNLIILIIVIIVITILFIIYFTTNKQKGSFNINNITRRLPYDNDDPREWRLIRRLDIIQNNLHKYHEQLINALDYNGSSRLTLLRNILSTMRDDNFNNLISDMYTLRHPLHESDINLVKHRWQDYQDEIVHVIEIIQLNDSEGTRQIKYNLNNKYRNLIASIDVIADSISYHNNEFINNLRNKANDDLLEKTFAKYYPTRYSGNM